MPQVCTGLHSTVVPRTGTETPRQKPIRAIFGGFSRGAVALRRLLSIGPGNCRTAGILACTVALFGFTGCGGGGSSPAAEQAAEAPPKPALVRLAAPVIQPDQPWEKRGIAMFGTVLHIDGKFRAWYLCTETDGVDKPEGALTAEYQVCYAESLDGENFTKPLIGITSMGRKTNIVIAAGQAMSVLYEPDAPPAERYKAAGGRIVAFSPDGINWTTETVAAFGKNDTGTSVVKWRGKYLAFVRYQVPDAKWTAGTMRGVGLSTSDDFHNWTPKELIFKTDDQDGYPWTQPYALSVTVVGDKLVGLLSVLHLDREDGNNSRGYRDIQVMVSTDGRRWERPCRDVFLAPSESGWDSAEVWPSSNVLLHDGQAWLYYSGSDVPHGNGLGRFKIGLARMPAADFGAESACK